MLQILVHAGGCEPTVVVDHGSGLRGKFLRAGILARQARLTGTPPRRLRPPDGLADLLWRRGADAVHIHGDEVAAPGLAAARWLDLPVIFTPAAPSGERAPPSSPRSFSGLFRRDPLARADGLVLLGASEATTPPPGKPLLRIHPAAPAGRITVDYRAFLEEVARRAGRELQGASPRTLSDPVAGASPKAHTS